MLQRYNSAKQLSDTDMHMYFEFEDIKSPNQDWIKISKVVRDLPDVIVFPSTVDGKRLMLPDSCAYFFCPHLNKNNDYAKGYYYYRNCEYIDFSNIIDTSNVINMANMFAEGYSLHQIVFGDKFDSSNVVNMSHMFAMCPRLEEIDLKNLKTDNVTSMEGMFFGCNTIECIDVSGFDTSNVISMYKMFYRCNSVKNLDVSRFMTSNVTNMAYMFYECRSLRYLDVSRFITSSVISMSFMFFGCRALHNINMFSNTENCTNMQYMFHNCDALESLDLSSFYTPKVQIFRCMFYGCGSLKNLNIKNFSFNSLKEVSEDDIDNRSGIYEMFGKCELIDSISLPDFRSVPSAETCEDLSVPVLVGDTENEYLKSEVQKHINIAKRVRVNIAPSSRSRNQRAVSRSASRTSQRALNNRNIDYQASSYMKSVGQATEQADVLSDKELIRYFDFKNVNPYDNSICISKVKRELPEKVILPEKIMLPNQKEEVYIRFPDNCSELFKGQEYVKLIDLSNINDISNINYMTGMFMGCSNLEKILLPKSNNTTKNKIAYLWDTSYMFSGCSKLGYIDIEGLNVNKLSNVEEMFRDCSSVQDSNIYLPDFTNSTMSDKDLLHLLDSADTMSNSLRKVIMMQLDKRKSIDIRSIKF